jgi:hypothetical protein
MVLLLTVLSGIAWTIVYIDSIRVGFKQKTYAMPIAALGLNIAWEWTYAVRDLTHDPQLQAWVNLIWALADVVILATYFRYGRSELECPSSSVPRAPSCRGWCVGWQGGRGGMVSEKSACAGKSCARGRRCKPRKLGKRA